MPGLALVPLENFKGYVIYNKLTGEKVSLPTLSIFFGSAGFCGMSTDTEQNAKSILITEDDEILGALLTKYLSSHGYNVTVLPEGERIHHVLDEERKQIDLIVLDIMLPGKDGLYWLGWLKKAHPSIPIIMASVNNDEDTRLLGLRNGARDYIVKPFHSEELLIRMERILRESVASVPVQGFRLGASRIDSRNWCLFRDGQEIRLTPQETGILKLLCLNAGETVSRETMVTHLWGIPYDPMNRKIDIHITKLRRKLADDSAHPRYIRTVRGQGYSLHVTKDPLPNP